MRKTLAETRLLLGVIFRDSAVLWVLLIVSLIIASLIAGYILTDGYPEDSMIGLIHDEIGLSKDRSIAEVVAYSITFLAAVSFFFCFMDSRSPVYLAMSLLMMFIWFDDSASYHERVGTLLVDYANVPALAGLRAQDTGELIAWGVAGAFLGLIFLFSLAKVRPGDRGALTLVVVGFALLVVFGILADFVHVLMPESMEITIGTIEDGGEMFALLFITAVALGLVRNLDRYLTGARAIAAT